MHCMVIIALIATMIASFYYFDRPIYKVVTTFIGLIFISNAAASGVLIILKLRE